MKDFYGLIILRCCLVWRLRFISAAPRRKSSVGAAPIFGRHVEDLMDGRVTEPAKARQNYCAEERIDGLQLLADSADHDVKGRDSAWMS